MEKISSVVLAVNLQKVAIMATGSQAYVGDPYEEDGQRITVHDFNRFFRLQMNIHFGGSGHIYCLAALKRTLLEEHYSSDFKSVRAAAKYLKNHINQHHSLDWYHKIVRAEFILVGNIVGSQKPFRTFKIWRKDMRRINYGCTLVEDHKSVIGSAREFVYQHWNKFQMDMDADEASKAVFELIRDAGGAKGAGDIRMIMFDKRYSKTMVFTESSRYQTKLETQHEKDTTSEVTRELSQIGPTVHP